MAVALPNTRRRWGPARRRMRILVSRAGQTQPAMQLAAVALLEGRDAAIHPTATVWGRLLADFHRTLDAALDDEGRSSA